MPAIRFFFFNLFIFNPSQSLRYGTRIAALLLEIRNSWKKLKRNFRQFRKLTRVFSVKFSWEIYGCFFLCLICVMFIEDHEISVAVSCDLFIAVLSDANKRFLYDVGAYNSDEDENVCQPILQSGPFIWCPWLCLISLSIGLLILSFFNLSWSVICWGPVSNKNLFWVHFCVVCPTGYGRLLGRNGYDDESKRTHCKKKKKNVPIPLLMFVWF